MKIKESSGDHALQVVVRRYSTKYVFLKISQNSQGISCAGVSFLIKLQAGKPHQIHKETPVLITLQTSGIT